MTHRMAHLYCLTDAEVGDDTPVLPETLRLLKRLETMAAEELEHFGSQDPGRTAVYRARPESNLPHLRFHVTDADQNLLAFVGQEVPGFEVLQVFCAGFQFHWRSDLARTFDEQVPLISRSYGLSDTRELVVEHLAVPIIRKHRVREVRGWLTFSQELDSCREWAGLDAMSMFRRTQRSRPLHLPTRLYDPERRHVVPEAMLRALKEKWRSATGQRWHP